MAPTNDILPFCPTDTGTNLLSQAAYAASPDLPIGNQPGVASSNLVNKVLRQSSFIASQFAQFLMNKTGTSIQDNANDAELYAQINAALKYYTPIRSVLTSGTGTFNLTSIFQTGSCNATANATYTHNGTTYTVSATVSGGTELFATGTAAPLASGTLTKASGTGDATIPFYAVVLPTGLNIVAVGGGGAGFSNGTSAGSSGAGAATTLGSNITANGGSAGSNVSGGGGGGASLSGGTGIAVNGTVGGSAPSQNAAATNAGGQGGSSPYAGGGACGQGAGAGGSAISNSGSGGGGAGSSATAAGGGGGGAGAYVSASISIPTSIYTWAYGVGAGGTHGTAGVGGFAGGDGGNGSLIITEVFN